MNVGARKLDVVMSSNKSVHAGFSRLMQGVEARLRALPACLVFKRGCSDDIVWSGYIARLDAAKCVLYVRTHKIAEATID